MPTQRLNRIAIDIANNAELRTNAQHVLSFTHAARPKNTSLAYNPKQEEFKVSRRLALYIFVRV